MVEVDFSDKIHMFENTKRNLLKLFGGIKSLTEDDNDTIRVVDENSTFYNKGFSPRGNTPFKSGNFGRVRGTSGQQRFSPPQARISGTASGGGSNPRILSTKLNPQKFGRFLGFSF